MQVVVNSLLTNYTKHGDGKTCVLFLHGWADTSKTFDLLVAELVKTSPSLQVIQVDLPGFGASQPPAEAWTLNDYSHFVADFLKKIQASPDVVVGHSNGGAIAIHGLASDVFATKKLILIASAGIRTKSLRKTMLLFAAKPAKLALKIAPQSTQKKVRGKLYRSIGSDYLVAEHMQETFKKVVSQDVVADAAHLQLPVCLIYGENDTATPPTYGKKFAETIKDSEYHEIPLAGHFVHQEQVYKVASICEEFMKR